MAIFIQVTTRGDFLAPHPHPGITQEFSLNRRDYIKMLLTLRDDHRAPSGDFLRPTIGEREQARRVACLLSLTSNTLACRPPPPDWPSLLNPTHAACTRTLLNCGTSLSLQSTSTNQQPGVPSATSLPPSEHLEFCWLQPWHPSLSHSIHVPMGTLLWPAEAPLPSRVHVKWHIVAGWERGQNVFMKAWNAPPPPADSP